MVYIAEEFKMEIELIYVLRGARGWRLSCGSTLL